MATKRFTCNDIVFRDRDGSIIKPPTLEMWEELRRTKYIKKFKKSKRVKGD